MNDYIVMGRAVCSNLWTYLWICWREEEVRGRMEDVWGDGYKIKKLVPFYGALSSPAHRAALRTGKKSAGRT